MSRKRRVFDEELKKQMVQLYNNGKPRNELIKLRKENKRLMMENDILKQAALIMARK